MAQKAGVKTPKTIPNEEFIKEIEKAKDIVDSSLSGFKFNEALEAVWRLIHYSDRYIEKERPWEEQENQKEVIQNLLYTLKVIAETLEAFLPATSEKIQAQLKGGKVEALFPRLEA